MAQPIEVRRSVTILKAREEVFEGLRQPGVLHGLFDDLSQVDARRFRWARRLVGGGRQEGEVALEELVENDRVSWRATGAGELPHAGVLRLRKAPGGRGTELCVTLHYDAPAGKAGVAVLRLLGDEPQQVLARHLHRLRQLLEAGEAATTAGQPSGRDEDLVAPRELALHGERP